jgi:hypothetical protein
MRNASHPQASFYSVVVGDNGDTTNPGTMCLTMMIGLIWKTILTTNTIETYTSMSVPPSIIVTTTTNWDVSGADNNYYMGIKNDGVDLSIIVRGVVVASTADSTLDPVAGFLPGDIVTVNIDDADRIYFQINNNDVLFNQTTYYIQCDGNFLTENAFPLISDVTTAGTGFGYHATWLTSSGDLSSPSPTPSRSVSSVASGSITPMASATSTPSIAIIPPSAISQVCTRL